MNKKDKGSKKGKKPIIKVSDFIKRYGPIKFRYETAEELRRAAWGMDKIKRPDDE